MKEDLERKLRRCRVNLSAVGTGVILFGAWTVLEILMMLIMAPEKYNLNQTTEYGTAVLVISVVISIFLEIGMRLIIGISARKEARGIKKGYFYIVLCIIYILLSLLIDATTFISDYSIVYKISTYLFIVCSAALEIATIVLSFRVKYLIKQIERGEGA